jgi:hypothetical protein
VSLISLHIILIISFLLCKFKMYNIIFWYVWSKHSMHIWIKEIIKNKYRMKSNIHLNVKKQKIYINS